MFLRRKGGLGHRVVGYVYVTSMLLMLVTAFMIYRLFGRFGPFHFAAMISSATLLAGFVPALLRRPRSNWLELHYGFMSWSYVGLLAAGAAEVLVRVPDTPFFGTVLGVSAAVMVVGGVLVSRLEKRVLSRLRPQRHVQTAP